jgi:hypothetical protein
MFHCLKQCCRSSADLLSAHFSFWGAGKSDTDLNSVSRAGEGRGGLGALECTYMLKVSWRGPCEPARYLAAEFMSSSSTVPAFSSSLPLGARSGPKGIIFY